MTEAILSTGVTGIAMTTDGQGVGLRFGGEGGEFTVLIPVQRLHGLGVLALQVASRNRSEGNLVSAYEAEFVTLHTTTDGAAILTFEMSGGGRFPLRLGQDTLKALLELLEVALGKTQPTIPPGSTRN